MSGLKVVIVAALVASLGTARRWSWRRRTLATLAVITLYIAVSGAGAAAMRSGLMVGAGLLLRRDGRRPHSFALLALCAALLLGIAPAVAADVGFQLSFLGTAGILLLAGPIAARVPGPRILAEPFAVTVAAELVTAPVTAATFGVVSLVGPIANAVALPLLPAIIVTGAAGALAGSLLPIVGAAVGWLPLQIAGWLSQAILAIAVGCAALPLAALHLQLWPRTWTAAALASGTGALLARGAGRPGSPRRRLAALAGFVAAGLLGLGGAAAATGTPALMVTVLDAGNATAVLIQPPGGGLVLIDGGGDSATLLTALGRVVSPLDRHLDAVALTATDRPTSAALAGLLGHYDVGTLMIAQPLPSALEAIAAAMAGTGTRVVPVGPGAWTVAGVTVRCVPTSPAPAAPCALQARASGAALLVTGNLALAAQDELVAVHARDLGASLLIGPSTTAPGTALLGAVRPALVAVPARREPPGLGPARAAGAEVAITGIDGDLAYQALPGDVFAALSN